MRSIERRFVLSKDKNTNVSSFIAFTHAIKCQNFSPTVIARWFNQLVDKGDYCKEDKKAILSHLTKLSNGAEEYKKQGVFASRKHVIA